MLKETVFILNLSIGWNLTQPKFQKSVFSANGQAETIIYIWKLKEHRMIKTILKMKEYDDTTSFQDLL